MKRVAIAAGLLFVLFSTIAWLATDPPYMRVEAIGAGTPENGYLTDGCRLAPGHNNPLAILIGNAHRGGSDQSDANTRLSYWGLQFARDNNMDGELDERDAPPATRPIYLVRKINDSATTIWVNSTTDLPSSGTVWIRQETVTYTSKTHRQLKGCARGAGGTDAAAHKRMIPVIWTTAARTTLTIQTTGGDTTLQVASTEHFPEFGVVTFGGEERVAYQAKTPTQLLYCERGYDGTVVMSPLAVGISVIAIYGFNKIRFTPGTVIGWENGKDDNGAVEGDIFQTTSANWQGALISGLTLPKGRWLIRGYCVDVHGNTNQEVGGVDQMALTGLGAQMGQDGDAAKGVSDREIVYVKVY